MSTPDQEARALARVRDFMYDLGNGTYRVESITRLRADARATMRHYPLTDSRLSPHQRQVLRDVTEHWRGHIDTHSESCWRWHAACLARVLRDLDDD